MYIKFVISTSIITKTYKNLNFLKNSQKQKQNKAKLKRNKKKIIIYYKN